jgi:hypothetical protein
MERLTVFLCVASLLAFPLASAVECTYGSYTLDGVEHCRSVPHEHSYLGDTSWGLTFVILFAFFFVGVMFWACATTDPYPSRYGGSLNVKVTHVNPEKS